MSERIDVKALVERAVGEQWPAFEREHPALAAVIATDLLVEQAVAVLSEDDDFKEAMAAAEAARVGQETLADVVSRFVRPVLRRLL